MKSLRLLLSLVATGNKILPNVQGQIFERSIESKSISGVGGPNKAVLPVVFLSGGAQWDDDGDSTTSRRHQSRSGLSRLAEKSLSLTSQAVSATAKQSGKAAYYLIRPKSVDLEELFGLWRLDQSVVFGDEGPVESAASIYVTPRGMVVVPRSGGGEDGRVEESRYTFSPSRLTASAKLEFTACAFSRGQAEPPIRFFYRAYVHRKVADTSVIKLKGKIYRIERVGWRGKNEKLVLVGTFVARRRLRLSEDANEDEGSSEEEWSDHEEEEEWSDHDDEWGTGTSSGEGDISDGSYDEEDY